MKKFIAWLMAVPLLYAPYLFAADVQAGADSFAANCVVCHSMANPLKTKVGPGLYGVVDRPSASVAGFQYSDALKASNIIWTKKNLDTYLTDPAAMIPNNKMPFKGLSSASERENIIEFLAQKKDKK